MNFESIFSKSWNEYKKNFRAIFLLTLIFVGIPLVLSNISLYWLASTDVVFYQALVTEESEKIYIKTSEGNKEVKILSEEAITKAQKIDTIEKVEIEEDKGKAVYSIHGTKRARLFFIFPVLAEVEQKINVEDGSLVSTQKPWWHFLALGI